MFEIENKLENDKKLNPVVNYSNVSTDFLLQKTALKFWGDQLNYRECGGKK